MTLSYIQLQNYSLADDCILNLSGGEDEDLQCGSIFLRCKIQCGKDAKLQILCHEERFFKVKFVSAAGETFGLVGFESIFTHLETISIGKSIKVFNDNIDISEPKISPVGFSYQILSR